MTESYVDLTYRGLPLARRVKLTHVRPREGYVEMPAPMPVGTQLQITTDDGVAIDVRVSAVTEQTAGAPGAPGMQLQPVLEGAAQTWWAERIALPDAPPKAERTVVIAAPPPAPAPVVPSKPITAPMRAVAPPAAAEPSPESIVAVPPPRPFNDASSPSIEIITPPDDEEEDRGERTRVMDAAVSEVMREQMSAGESNPRMGIVDDGQHTTIMAAVDLSALGLEPPAGSGLVPEAPMAADTGSGVPELLDDKSEEVQSRPVGASGATTVKRRRKKKSPT